MMEGPNGADRRPQIRLLPQRGPMQPSGQHGCGRRAGCERGMMKAYRPQDYIEDRAGRIRLARSLTAKTPLPRIIRPITLKLYRQPLVLR